VSEEPSQRSFLSFFSNLFSKEKNNSNKTIETPDDEQIEELIQNVLKIKDAIVREIMIPKVNISYINEDSDMQEVYKTIQDTRHSRYPVFDKTSENAVGVLHVKDLIDEEINDKNFKIKDLLREVKYVPETQSVTSLLEDFKKDRAHLAMVLDEYGMLVGLITIEDILEEIVGEIEDEFYEEKTDEIIKINQDEFFEINLNSQEVESIGGFVLKKFGHLPKVGESFEDYDLRFTVTSADQRKIKKITVRKID